MEKKITGGVLTLLGLLPSCVAQACLSVAPPPATTETAATGDTGAELRSAGEGAPSLTTGIRPGDPPPSGDSRPRALGSPGQDLPGTSAPVPASLRVVATEVIGSGRLPPDVAARLRARER